MDTQINTSSERTVSRGAWVVCILLAAIPFLFLVSLVWRSSVDVPVMDQWELVPKLDKMYQGKLAFHDLWAQHNEHRPFFPLLIMICLARLTHWNTKWELLVIILLAVGIFAFLAYQMRLTGLKSPRTGVNWLIPLVCFIVFAPGQMENWIWGWQIQVVMNVFAVVAGIVLLAHPVWDWRRFAGALVFGIVALYSFANGMLYWVIGLPVILLVPRPNPRVRNLALACWIVVGGLTIAAYAYKYHRPEEHVPLTLALWYPAEYLKYIFAYLGAACTGLVDTNPQITGLVLGQTDILRVSAVGAAGVLVYVASVVIIVRRGCARFYALVPYLAISAYAVGSALVTGLARLGLGTQQALSSRYVTISSLFWVSLLVFLYMIATRTVEVAQGTEGERPMSAKASQTIRRTAWALILVVALMIAANARHGIRLGQERHESYAEIAQAILDIERGDLQMANARFDVYTSLYPDPQVVEERLEVLREHHLSLFRGEQ